MIPLGATHQLKEAHLDGLFDKFIKLEECKCFRWNEAHGEWMIDRKCEEFIGFYDALEIGMSEELKPCPFCGGDAELVIRAIGTAVMCFTESCECAFTAWHTLEADAVKQWNTRAPQSELVSVETLNELYPTIRAAWKQGDLDYSTWKKYNKSIGNDV